MSEMNEEQGKPFEVVGDEALEARIVAWVLGEASEFGADELQRLCSERPELEVFRRRIAAVHGLAGEALRAPATDWKLAAEKRARVLAVIGARQREERRERSSRIAARRVLWAIAACLVLTVAVAALVFPARALKRSAPADRRTDTITSYFAASDAEGGGREAEVPGQVIGDRKGNRPEGMVRLETELPDELVEGTPVDVAERLDSSRLAARPEAPPPATTPPAPALDAAGPVSGEADGSDLSFKLQPGDVIVVPEKNIFGDAGSGEDRPVAGTPAAASAQPDTALGLRSGSVATALHDVDADIDAPQRAPEDAGLAGTVVGGAVAAPQSDLAKRVAGPAASAKRLELRNGGGLGTEDDFGTGWGGGGGFAGEVAGKPVAGEPAAPGGQPEGGVRLGRPRRGAVAGGNSAEAGRSASGLEWKEEGAKEAAAININGVADRSGERSRVSRDPVQEKTAAEEVGADARARRSVANRWSLEYRSRGLQDGRDAEPPDDALARQEQLAEEKRKVLNSIVETKASVHKDGESRFGTATSGHDKDVDRLSAGYGPGNKERDDLTLKEEIESPDIYAARDDLERELTKLEEMRGEPNGRQDEWFRQGQAATSRKSADIRPDKQQAAIDLMAEVAVADEPFSTFSLHVSDASFRVAAAAFARGERPAAETVRPEEFYNAFDYGDPAPTADEPVACTLEQCRHPLLPSRNLVRIAVRTAAAGRGAGQPLRLTVLLDCSGSMERDDRRAAVLAAAGELAGLLGDADLVSVVGFARQPRLLGDRLGGAAARDGLARLVAQTPAEGGTNLEAALALAGEIAQRQFDAAAQNRVVLLTDGAANLGNADPEVLAARIEGLRQRGIAFDAAGFGTAGLNDAMLERLTRDGNGRYYVVDRVEDAGPGFAARLAGAFRPAAENVKVQVRFNPGRVAAYRLIGFEEHRLAKEDFRNDAVDAAEMAAEEAGVALYQVELLPGGEGELGEVSVRFRDAAAGQMVERCWTVAHEPAAPAFDQAAPPLQLAGLAALAADALCAGPLAPLTDWGELAPVVARVRAAFAGSARVAELGEMIGKLRD